ncbi:hypothetical protein GIB67_025135 [Kingdonia uniflora]|uniref:Uncharacterized protein n=1 Tax=Kingdonia uniflora TaxID=39325 RepID=A0A7J7N7R4_9MAGN|nr:hypothetical protein GIB67_025135 [Kingdonia uniflora]
MGIFLKVPEKFIATNYLIVTPFSFISSLSFLEREKVPMDDIEVRVVNVGHEKALRLLEAFLTSGSLLSSAFNIKKVEPKKPKEEKLRVSNNHLDGILRGSRRDRLLSKFVESEYEKIDCLMELFTRSWMLLFKLPFKSIIMSLMAKGRGKYFVHHREFCKSKALIGGRWLNFVEHAGRPGRGFSALPVSVGEWVESAPKQSCKKDNERHRGISCPVEWEHVRGSQSKVKKKKSLLDTVAQKGVKLEVVLKGLGVRSNKKRGVDGERRVVMPKASVVDYIDVSESTTLSKLAQVFPKKKMLKRGSTSGTTGSGEVEEEVKKRRVDPSIKLIGVKVAENRPGEEDELKAVEDRARLVARKGVDEISKVAARLMKGICLGMEEEKVELETKKTELEKKNLNEVVVQRDRLGCHLLKIGYSKAEANDIMEDTYVEEEEDEADGAGVVSGLDGISPQIERDNQVHDIVNPKNENENENEKVKLESAPLSEEETRQYNQEFTTKFDRMREANEDMEDQHVNVHFKFVEAIQTIDDLTRKIEEKDVKISKGQKGLAEAKEETTKLKSQDDTLMVKSKEAGMTRYRIQDLKTSEKELPHFVASLKDQMISKTNK